jgi:hypothetical protein
VSPPDGQDEGGHAGQAPPDQRAGGHLTAGQDRAGYLAEVSRLLWPPPARITLSGSGSGSGHTSGSGSGHTSVPGDETRPGDAPAPAAAGAAHRELIVLPGSRRPRLLVPAGRRAAAAAVRRYGEPGSLGTRLGTRALWLVLASGLGGTVLTGRLRIEVPVGAPAIDSYLSACLGQDLQVSMHLGAARANRKPVLQLLAADGDTVGFAKIAVSPLTRDLVHDERAALALLGEAELDRVMTPRVLHYGSWRGLDVLVLSPLPVWLRRRPLPDGSLALAMDEVARMAGIEHRPLVASAYWQRLTARLSAADESQDRAALHQALRELGGQAGTATLAFGAWHGDWTPWNMASTSSGLLVWDWERFAVGVPLGFDALHYWLQAAAVPGRRDPLSAAAACIENASALLAPFGIAAAEARLTALAYLADLATRYLTDRQAETGARLGAPGRWLIPALAAEVARL